MNILRNYDMQCSIVWDLNIYRSLYKRVNWFDNKKNDNNENLYSQNREMETKRCKISK